MKTLLTIALASLAAAPLASQTEQAPAIGSRVRITLPDTVPATNAAEEPRPLIVTGKIIAIGDSTLLVRAGADDVSISRDLIQRFEVGTGTERTRTAQVGTVVGLVIGGVLGYASGEDCMVEDFICFTREDTAMFGGAIGAVLGAAIGFAAGGVRWRDAGLPARVGFVPTSSRSVMITSTLRF
jgi:hypothetical protein